MRFLLAIMKRFGTARLLRGVALVGVVLGVVTTFGSAARAHPPGDAIISNGTIQLGVHPQGHLNVPGGTPSSGTGTTYVGLRYVPTNAEATAPGCLCEGWGAADAVTGVTGYANEAGSGVQNMTLVSFVSTPLTALSVVDIGTTLRVTHDYHPSPATPNLYEVVVTIENRSSAAVDLRYRRVMDWDVEPTAFSEFVTINGGTSTALLYDSNNGFETANPLGPRTSLGFTGNFTDAGPLDHGALFDFGFGMLGPGQTKAFKIFYGAAGTEAGALAALGAVGAEVYSLGQSNTPGGPTLGTPNTFIFAFAGVGGTPIVRGLTLEPTADENPVGTSHTVTATLTEGGSPAVGAKILFSVSGANSASGSGTTGADGKAPFTYTGTSLGSDTITACHDANGNSACDVGETTATATKTWVSAAPATLVLTPPTDTNKAGEEHCVTATVKDAAGNPTPNIKVVFSVSGANTAGGTVTTTASGEAIFCYTGTKAGEDAITAFADTDGSSAQNGTEPAGAATKTYVAAAPATLVLTPPTATNVVGTQHCVTATVKDALGNPASGVTVRFSVTGSIARTGTKTTDGNGQATFCYTGPELPGSDAITAHADSDNDSVEDVGEPVGAATKTWILPVSTPLCQVSITNGGRITANNGDKATFGGNAQVPKSGQPKGSETYQDHGPAVKLTVKSTKILAVVCSADQTQASIYGEARINGTGSYLFKIDVQDLAEPGVGMDTYRILIITGYDSGVHTLEGGNIQIKIG